MSTRAQPRAKSPSSPGGAIAPLLVLALDGATFDVIRPLARAGQLPHLGSWLQTGSTLPLRSTRPPVTFPAWSSFMTGCEPGQHGIFDFTQKQPGAYRVRFVNASDRRGESLFARVTAAGGRVLVLGMPAAFPPEPVRGLLVSGFDAPVSTGTDSRSASDPELYDAIARRVGPWMRPDLDERARARDFHERALPTLRRRVARKRDFALEALRQMRARGEEPDLVMVVFSESDTVGHHYWRDHDPASPRHDPSASAARRGAIAAVYAELDAACGAIRGAFRDTARCVVLSDHGMGGASRRIVHLNHHLASCGLLERSAVRSATGGLARQARNTALALLPAGIAQRLFRSAPSAAARLESAVRFGGFDWRRTSAFSEEANTQPGVWINLAGREASGCVASSDYERAREDTIAALRDWTLPDGTPVVARAERREAVYEGPFVARAPDIVVELGLDAGYGLSLVPTPWSEGAGLSSLRLLSDEELGGGRGQGMNGTHRPDGIWIWDGDDDPLPLRSASPARPSLSEAAPALLRAMGIEWRLAADGATTGRSLPYSAEEDAMVAERLRALGYLE